MANRERRLVFGEVADLYDARRPGYPETLIDDLAAWAALGGGRPRALEVGAGTGKATRLLAARGVDVVAIEPSAEMAAIVRRRSEAPDAPVQSPFGHVEVIESDFEHAELGGRRFGLLFAAQAWHWVDQTVGYARARAALQPGGRLVPFWNRPQWSACALRPELTAAYAAHAPELDRFGSMHPDAPDDAGEEAFWTEAIAAADGFGDPQIRTVAWTAEHPAGAYAELLGTMSAVRLLSAPRREALLGAVAAAITDAGGTLTLPMRTIVCSAVAG